MATARPAPELRPNVCAVLTDEAQARVLVFRRVDSVLGEHRWQFPQGGVKPGEAPEAALRRELREEIGTDAVELLASLPEPIAYWFPPEVLASLRSGDPRKARYRGQAQTWYLARLPAGTQAIRFDHQPPEFDAFEWVTPAEAMARVVPFKREAYRQALSSFGLLAPAAP
jgi:putative (di)nucleoside polyphosphate hydrolase